MEGPACFLGDAQCPGPTNVFLSKFEGEKMEFEVEENVLIYHINILFIFVSTQSKKTSNFFFMKGK